jgi:DNA primase
MIDYLSLLDKYGIGIDRYANSDNVFIDRCPNPDHIENTPSCGFNFKTGLYNCLGCHESGNFEKLLIRYTGISKSEAKRELMSLENTDSLISEIENDLDELGSDEVTTEVKYLSIKSFHNRYISLEQNEKAWQYMLSRGFTSETIKRFDFRYGGDKGRWADRVIFPIYNEVGKLLTFTGRTLIKNKNPKYKNVRGRSNLQTLFGLHQLFVKYGVRHFKYLIIEEGGLDAAYLQQFGICSVATTGTSNLKAHQIYLLKKHCDIVILNYDEDQGGDHAFENNERLIKRYMPVTQFHIPIKNRDPNDLKPLEVKRIYKEFIHGSV